MEQKTQVQPKNARKIAIIAIVAVVLALVAGLVYSIVINKGDNDAKVSVPQDVRSVAEISDDARYRAENGDLEGAVADLNKSIDNESDPAKKNDLRIKLSLLYINQADDVESALTEAEKTIDESGNSNYSAHLASLYERVGDKEKAVEYYKKTVAKIEEGGLRTYDYDRYVEKIKVLESK